MRNRILQYVILALSAAAWLYAIELEPPRFSVTASVAPEYVDGGYVCSPDPILNTTYAVNWYGAYLRHWEMWDLTDYYDPDRRSKYDNSRKYRIEICNYVGGYTAPLDKLGLPFRLTLQAKYTQYPRRRSVKRHDDGHIHYHHHVKGEQLAAFIRFNNFLPDSTKARCNTSIEIDYQPLSYYWLFKEHTDLYYPLNDVGRIGVSHTLYTKTSRARASSGHTGFAVTAIVATPYIRFQLTENVYIRAYFGFSAALEPYTRDVWRRSDLNNRRNHWWGTSLTYTF